MNSRLDFRKKFGAGAAVTLYSRELFGQMLADSPKGRVLETRFKGLADIVLAEGKMAGCSYTDVRFTMTSSLPGVTVNLRPGAAPGTPGGGGAGGGGGRGGRGGGRGQQGIPSDADRTPGGFGVRVIHSGVWGFASSPILTEDELRRVTRVAVEVAKASAIAKKADMKLAPVKPYQEHYITPLVKHPTSVSQTDKQAWAQAIADKAAAVKGVTAVNVGCTHGYEWRYFASSEGSYIEQELFTTSPTFSVTAKVGDVTRTRNYSGVAGTGGWEFAERADFLAEAEKVATDARI
jgi:TldD protein